MTEISEYGVSLQLPGQWERTESEQPGSLVYRDTEGDDTVTVMLLSVRPVYAIADKERLLGDYVQHRQKFELGQRPSLQQSEPVTEDGNDSFEARWDGIDTATGAQQRHRTILSQNVLADFCYESPDTPLFAERVVALLASASVSAE